MPDPIVLVHGLDRPVALRSRPGSGGIVVALRSGRLLSVDVATRQEVDLASTFTGITTFDLSVDGRTAYVGGRTLGLRQVPLDGAPTARLARNVGRPGAILVDPTGATVLIAEGQAPGRLFERTLQPPQGMVSARGLAGARGMVVERATGRIIVADSANGGRLVEPPAPGANLPTVLLGGLGRPVDLAWRDATETHLVVTDAAGGRVLLVDILHSADPPVELFTGLTPLWGAQPVDGGQGGHRLGELGARRRSGAGAGRRRRDARPGRRAVHLWVGAGSRSSSTTPPWRSRTSTSSSTHRTEASSSRCRATRASIPSIRRSC